LFRNNIKSKFSPQIAKEPTNPRNKNAVNTSYVSSLPPSILAKTANEVNKISKYFKKNPSNNQKELYAQVLANSSNSPNTARKILKIKETFSSLQNKKIINSTEKPKLKINITTKEPLQKQVIVLMNTNSTNSFIKDSSTYIININKTLKNIKLNVMMDFIHIDNKGIIIITNNIASPLDL